MIWITTCGTCCIFILMTPRLERILRLVRRIHSSLFPPRIQVFEQSSNTWTVPQRALGSSPPGGARGGDISVANSAVSFPTEMPPHTFVRGSRPYIIRFGRSIMQQVPGKCLCFPYLFRKRMSQAFACKWHAIRYYFRVFLRGSSPFDFKY